MKNGTLEEYGSKEKEFVERYNRDGIVDEFERILEEVIKDKGGK